MSAARHWVRLDGAVNVRDLGDLPTDDGGRTAPGRLLRADNLQALSRSDIQVLVVQHRVRLVLDLRTEVEVRLEGPAPLQSHPDVRHEQLSLLPAMGDRTDFAVEDFAVEEFAVEEMVPWQSDDRRSIRGGGPQVVAELYRSYLTDRPDSVVAALLATARQASGATLVHCAAGKDRTGVVVALALSVAGVDREAIVEDYAATAEVLPALVARLESSTTYARDVAGRPLDSHRPVAETMRRFLRGLDEEFGTPAGWLARHGFGADGQQALRTRLLG